MQTQFAPTHPPIAADISVGMGQLELAESPQRLWAILGSCIGVVLYHPRKKLAAMAHVVLASSNGRSGSAGRFADTAIPEAIRRLEAAGANAGGLVAKIAGGAAMFGVGGPLKTGADNATAVRAALAAARIPLVAEHVGEGKGRKVTFDPTTGKLLIEIAGQASLEL